MKVTKYFQNYLAKGHTYAYICHRCVLFICFKTSETKENTTECRRETYCCNIPEVYKDTLKGLKTVKGKR